MESKEETHALKLIVLVSFSFVVLMGFLLTLSLLSPLPPENSSAPQRQPATIASSQSPPADLNMGTGDHPHQNTWNATMQIDCPLSPGQVRKTSAKRVRLVGSLCKPPEAPLTARTLLINESNGHQGTLFQLAQAREFTTDYIDLIEGPNRIKMTRFTEEGQRLEAHFIIQKMPQ